MHWLQLLSDDTSPDMVLFYRLPRRGTVPTATQAIRTWTLLGFWIVSIVSLAALVAGPATCRASIVQDMAVGPAALPEDFQALKAFVTSSVFASKNSKNNCVFTSMTVEGFCNCVSCSSTCIKCDAKMEHILSIDFSGNTYAQFSTSLSVSDLNLGLLANMSHLTTIAFRNPSGDDWGQLTGTLPVEVFSSGFKALTTFDLSYNRITDLAPVCEIPTLTSVIMAHNKLTGSLPGCILRMPELAVLDVTAAGLSGSLADNHGVGVSPNFEQLLLAGNAFDGPVPTSLFTAPRLVVLDMTGSSFIGTLPTALWAAANLTTVRLPSIGVTGTLPNSMLGCPLLEEVDLSTNSLSGNLPSDLGALAALQSFDISGNSFHGNLVFDAQIYDAPLVLRTLRLGKNRLSSTLPPGLGELQSLQVLDLAGNAFYGDLPLFSDSSQLQSLILTNNNFSGILPARSLPSLMRLHAGNNNFSAIDWWSSRVSGSVLTEFMVSNNARLAHPWISHLDSIHFPETIAAIDVSFTQISLDSCYCSVCPTGGGPGLDNLRFLDISGTRNVEYNFPTPAACSLRGGRSSMTRYFSRLVGKPITSFAAAHTGLSMSVSSLIGLFPLALTLDVSYAQLTGTLPRNTSNVVMLRLGGNKDVTGPLPSSPSSFLVYLDVSETSMHAPVSDQLPSYTQAGESELFANGSSSCRSLQAVPPSLLQVTVGNEYDDFARCSCKAGFAGSRVRCHRCPVGSWSLDNSSSCEPCPAGTYQPAGTEQSSDATCVPCPTGFFSHAGTAGTTSGGTDSDAGSGAGRSGADCFACPGAASGVTCGARQVNVDSGWWWPALLRLGTTADRTYACLSPSSCPAPSSSLLAALANGTGIPATCSRGSGGPLCAVCDSNSGNGSSWVLTSAGHCTECPHFAVVAVAASVAVVAFLLFVLYTLHRTAERQYGSNTTGAASGNKRGGRSALRILVSFLQVTALMGEFRNRGSALLHSILRGAGTAGGDSVASLVTAPLACAFDVSFVQQLAAAAALPLACVAVVVAWAAAQRACRCCMRVREQHSQVLSMRHEIVSGAAAVGFLLYTRLTKLALSAFKTHSPAIEGVTYLQADFRVWTTQPGYGGMVALAATMVLLYTVAAPVFAFVSLQRANAAAAARTSALSVGLIAPDRVDDDNERDSIQGDTAASKINQLSSHPLGMLIRGYRPQVWWWEVTVIGRKVAMALLAVFVDGRDLQTLLAQVLLVALMLLQMANKPYLDDRLNKAELLSLFSLFLTAVGSLMYSHVDATQVTAAAPEGGDGGIALTVGLLVLNSGTVIVLLRLYWAEAPWRRLRCCCCRRRTQTEIFSRDDSGVALSHGEQRASNTAFPCSRCAATRTGRLDSKRKCTGKRGTRRSPHLRVPERTFFLRVSELPLPLDGRMG